ncbi:nuclear transport factor 2 family protein [Corallococcus exiguus]|uniref:nuclear transport factor 2 family protein n=1 Tax=Corallococcus TaxID=83461 RepID=UPI000EA2BF7A|nr:MULTISPECIES: nuclear transport factor 2 family protein [Corallococcus]RKI45666.1 nuclear transport factor 2 family protein [Corallococcus sp. AB004]NNB88159.1 nuclear transport factor 2 family protein [Corallococcus exiguus]NNB98552.1 nuclear transport factor 2 family protein [Corallococcus exiguus]NNC03326.1 nuclear transport factor 2 family protein [Corallococcus exiguus]NPC46166.1 nuclear transport factor 2 family protein [Corallococcus exiguus]
MKLQTTLTTVLALATGAAEARDPAQDERELLKVEAALCRAFETADVAALRKSLDARFTLTDSKGTVTDLEQNLAEVAKKDPVYEVFRNHHQKIRLYGDAAVVTGITTLKGHSGKTQFEGDFQFTDTWVYREGQWKLAASHATRLAK